MAPIRRVAGESEVLVMRLPRRAATPVVVATLVLPVLLTAQQKRTIEPSAAPSGGGWKPSRTADGQPDFQGTWVNNTATPFLRPRTLSDKATLSDEELAVLKTRAARLFNGDGDTAPGDELFEMLLKDPGKVVTSRATGDYNQWRRRASSPPTAPRIGSWLGDSRGRWEGDTLVIDTTNFHPQSVFRIGPLAATGAFSSERFHAIERLTQLGPDTMQYEVTVDDPTTWIKPWTAVTTWQRTRQRMYEDACHEGNYGMEGMLRGARADERARTIK